MKLSFVLVALLTPFVCFGSDMSGAVPIFLGGLVVFSLLTGAVVAAILRFGFKKGKGVWWIVAASPLVAFLSFAFYLNSQRGSTIHAGPNIPYHGSHSVTVSQKFGEKELQNALAKIESKPFGSNLYQYVTEPTSNLVYALDLAIPAERNARRFVTISTQPEIYVNTPTYEGVMYLFSKAVIESDPLPSDEVYSEPIKTESSNATEKP
jgi:hypothetical protein